MKLYKNLLIIVAVAVLSALSVTAQTSMSAYSKYGYGMLMDNATGTQRAMGGIGYAMNSGRQINAMNPASYAAIDSLTFLWDFGLSLSALRAEESDTVGNSMGGGLDYITMQFPMGKYMGGSIGLVPYSSVGYDFSKIIENGAEGQVGTGGINELYVGVSGRIYKGLTLGVNFSYMFGKAVNDMYGYTNTGSTAVFQHKISVQDWNFKAGLQYSVKLAPKHKATLGLVYTPAKSLHGDALGVYYDLKADEAPDTVASMDLKGNNTLPNTLGGGISYTYDNRFMIEADVTYQNWSDAKYEALEIFNLGNTFSDRWKYAIGGEIVPKHRGSYFEVMRYRFGTYYTHDYLTINGNNVHEYGASIGLGFPTPSDKTMVNVGFEYKRRNTSPKMLIKEDYFTITVGVNFNELWFWQSKLD